jgi:hypothetical protein
MAMQIVMINLNVFQSMKSDSSKTQKCNQENKKKKDHLLHILLTQPFICKIILAF